MTPTEQQLRDWGFTYQGVIAEGFETEKWRIGNFFKNIIVFTLKGEMTDVYLNQTKATNCTSLSSLQVLLHLFDMI